MTRQELAVHAAKEAGKIHLKYFGRPVESSNKNPRDIVTIADTEADQSILALIKRYYPDDSVLTEESGLMQKTSEFQWIVDPLDGTSNFYKGSPDFCVLIALRQNDETVFGVAWFPVTTELFIAERGKGATCNNQPLRVSEESSPANAYGNTHMSSGLEKRRQNLHIYEQLLFQARNIHVINACIGRLLCDVAAGRAEFHFRVGLNPWDYAVGLLLVEEAGGRVSDNSNQPITPQTKIVLATNGLCHDELLNLM